MVHFVIARFFVIVLAVSWLFSGRILFAGKLRVCFIDVGQGDAIFIRYPDNETMLIDSGDIGKGEIVNRFLIKENVRELDYYVWSHPHADHLGGVEEILGNYDVKQIYDSGPDAASQFYEKLLEYVESQKDVKYSLARRGNILKIGGADLKFFNPPARLYSGTESDLNENSIVLKLKYGNISFLLTGDAGKPAEEEIVELFGKELESQVLKVGHHGSKTASSPDFINRVKPQYAVIQVGRRNKYRHPANATLLTLEESTGEVLRNDFSGNIIMETDGKELIVKTEDSDNIETGTARRTANKRSKGAARNSYEKEYNSEEDTN